ncbi:MAG: hypothetical protein JSS89_13205 [Bacteroidetes bacterium]|nr:hypothetical protein [Bacteroidota bacterium]
MSRVMAMEFSYDLGEIVYLKHDTDQLQRMVTNICIDMGYSLRYGLSCGTMHTWHYPHELTKDKQIINELKQGTG